MILKFARKTGEKDKEHQQLEDISRIIKIAQRGTEWVELNISEHVNPKVFNSFCSPLTPVPGVAGHVELWPLLNF